MKALTEALNLSSILLCTSMPCFELEIYADLHQLDSTGQITLLIVE